MAARAALCTAFLFRAMLYLIPLMIITPVKLRSAQMDDSTGSLAS
jgi:hypothetical protein